MAETDTSWIVKGAKVAVLTTGNFGDRVRFDTVERLTKTQIVLAGAGDPFRRDDLRPARRRGGYDTECTELVRPDDQRVVDLRACVALRKLVKRITDLAKDQKGGPAEVLATLDRIEQAVTSATQAVAGLLAITDHDTTTRD